MRNSYFLGPIFLTFIVFSFGCDAQSNSPLVGYDNIRWGSSIKNVMKYYPTIKEVYSDDSSIGIREFEQNDVGGGISSRIFFFYKDELYRINVYYQAGNEDTGMKIKEMLVDAYGEFDETKDNTNPETSDDMKNLSFHRFYNQYLTIVLSLNTLQKVAWENLNTVPNVIYVHPRIHSEIEAAKERNNKLKL
jgi:hypothetical protein